MTTYDVIVAGAGPAGSTAARECASRGMSVLLLDKAVFPRDKPCGGGVNVRAARLLPFDLGPAAERAIYGMFVSVNQAQGFTRYAPEPLTYLTQRRHLDTFLAEQAQRAGVTFRERTPVKEVERSGSKVLVKAGSETFQGRALVAADGANGPTVKLAGVPVARWTAIALEGNVTPSPNVLGEWRDTVAIDVGGAPGGYGWLFPKGDHLNVGVGGWHRIGPQLRRRLDELTRFYGFDPVDLWGTRGHPLPVRQPHARLTDGPVMVTGDAAGLLDPLTGEGIYAAIWSGSVAARHLAAYLQGWSTDLGGYQREVDRELMVELRTATQLHDLFHLAPGAWIALLRRSDRVWGAACRLLTGDLTYLGIRQRWPGLSGVIDLASDSTRAGAHRMGWLGGEDSPAPERFLKCWAYGARRSMSQASPERE